MTIFREKATSALAGFHAGPLSWSNWNPEMLVLRRENPQCKARTNNKLKPHIALGWNGARATLVGGTLSPLRYPGSSINQHEYPRKRYPGGWEDNKLASLSWLRWP